MENVIRVNLCGTHNKLTQALYQYDYGQVLLVEGISLPETYEVHFANERDGETVTVIGTSEGVQIPDTLLETGKDITAYIYLHEAETDGETEYVIRIPVHNRPRPADFEPTEEEEITIASLLTAMNNAIEHASQSAQDAAESAEAAEEAIGSYEEMTAAASDLPNGSQPTSVIDRTGDHPVLRLGIPEGKPGNKGDPGDDGYSPTITVADITGGHRITITDEQGAHVFDVMNGGKGDKGDPGDDGFSPTVTVTNITGGHRVTITDAQGDHTFDVMDGQGGSGGAVTSVNGETGAVVLDGTKINVNNSAQTQNTVKDALDSFNRALNAKANTSVIADDYDSTATYAVGDYCIHEGVLYKCNTAIATAEAWTAAHWTATAVMLETGGGGGVSDVQVNGTSIVQNGVANVPIAGSDKLGVVKIGGSSVYGLAMSQYIEGLLYIDCALQSQIKSGDQFYRPIVPGRQHESAFYGLAKAAGDSTQSASNNAVGTYTDEAKQKIRAMLGIKDWQSIMLTESDYDSTVGAFVLDVGDGNEISEARVYGQIVWDSGSSDAKIAVGFGNNSGYDNYNKFSIKTGIPLQYRIAITAEGKNVIFSSGTNNIVRMQYGYGYYGTNDNANHGINVDATCGLEMSNKGTCAYWNYNNPRFFSIYAPAGMTWANLFVEYVLR